MGVGREEAKKFKVILNYKVSLRPAWAIMRPYLKKKKIKKIYIYVLIKPSLNFKVKEHLLSVSKVLGCKPRITKIIILLRTRMTNLNTYEAEAEGLLGFEAKLVYILSC